MYAMDATGNKTNSQEASSPVNKQRCSVSQFPQDCPILTVNIKSSPMLLKILILGFLSLSDLHIAFSELFSFLSSVHFTLCFIIQGYFKYMFFPGFLFLFKVKVLVTQSHPILCNPLYCSPPGSSVHGIF